MVCAHPDQLMLTVDVGTGERKGWREEEERVSGGRVRVGIRQQSVRATGPFWDRLALGLALQILSLSSQCARRPALPRAGQAVANTAGARPQSSFIKTLDTPSVLCPPPVHRPDIPYRHHCAPPSVHVMASRLSWLPDAQRATSETVN